MEWSDDDDDDENAYQNNNYYTNSNNNNRNDNNNNVNENYQDESDNTFDSNKELKNEKQKDDESLTFSDDDENNSKRSIDSCDKNTSNQNSDNVDNTINNNTNNTNKKIRKNILRNTTYEAIQVDRSDRFIPWDRIVASIYHNPISNNDHTYDDNNNNSITEDTILNYIPYPEMDQLLSWATDYNTNNESTTSSNNNDDNMTTTIQKEPYLHNNPLECLSNSSTNNVPINPIYLQYIQDTAIELITGQEDKLRRKKTRSFKTNNNNISISSTTIKSEPIIISSSSCNSSSSKNIDNKKELLEDQQDEQNENQKEEKENEKKTKTKRHYSKRGSIQYHQKYSEFYEKIVPNNISASIENCLLEKFDTSAFVAIGMIIEEMITSSLLPLAQQHINYCQQLEKHEQEQQAQAQQQQQNIYTPPIQPYDIQKKHSFFHWTLPPEEAIANLIPTTLSSSTSSLSSSVNSDNHHHIYQTILGLPSAYPPTRCLTKNVLPYLKSKESNKEKEARKTKLKKRLQEEAIVANSPYDISVSNWCMTRKYPDSVRNIHLKRRESINDTLAEIRTKPIYNYDIDLFRILVPQLPVPYRTQKEMRIPKPNERTIDKRYIPDPCGLQYPDYISKISNSINPIPTNSFSNGSIVERINTMYQIKNEDVTSNTNDNDAAISLTSAMKKNDLRKKQHHSDNIGGDDEDDDNNNDDTSNRSLEGEMNIDNQSRTVSLPIPIDTGSNRKVRPLMSQLRKKLLLNETRTDKLSINSSKKRQLNQQQQEQHKQVTITDRQQQRQQQQEQQTQEDLRQQREGQQRQIRMRQGNQQLRQQIEQSQQQLLHQQEQLQIQQEQQQQQQIGISQHQQQQQQGQQGPQSQERQRRQQQQRRPQAGEERQQQQQQQQQLQQGDAQLLMDHRQVIESQIVDSWFGRSEGTEDDDFETAEL